MIYLAFTFALALACVAALEYFYLMFLEARNRQIERHVSRLERQNAELLRRVRRAESELAAQFEKTPDVWPEFVDDEAGK